MNSNTLLADPQSLEIEKFISGNDLITIVVRSILPTASCPDCHRFSGSLKSRYLRRLADLPWHGVKIKLLLKVRKFRCRNNRCRRKVFCERLPKVAAAYARRTSRLEAVISLLAFALGGRGGAKASIKLNLPVGKDTLLRTLRRQPEPDLTGIKILGVDDFAFRKGSSYGTILVDLQKRQPVDILPDRNSATLQNWLLNHPDIEIVTRDRSIGYAEAVNKGLPGAEQVADRWHLLKNLSELLETILLGEQSLIKHAFQMVHQPKSVTGSEVVFKNPPVSKTEIHRRELYGQIKDLFSKGWSIRKTGNELGISRNTVRRYLRAADFPSRQSGQGSKSKLREYAEFLWQRWREGEENAQNLFTEIKKRGFAGSVSAVRRYVQKWRSDAGRLIKPPLTKCYSFRQTAKLLLTKSAEQSAREFVGKMRQLSPKIAVLQDLGIEFRTMIRNKREDLFDEWLKKVQMSEITELKNWVRFLLTDEKAVRSAMTSEWSNGQTEGQVNRLKTIKRQIYGRANFDLLKVRVLHQG